MRFTRIRVVRVVIQVEGNLRELEKNVSREASRATCWEAKTWLSNDKGVPLCALTRFSCHAQEEEEEENCDG